MMSVGQDRESEAAVVTGRFARDLNARTAITIELPEFLLRAFDARLSEANEGMAADDHATLADYIECELVNLVTVRDIAELDLRIPGFAEAVHAWVLATRQE